jgi:hypothetical protein
LGLELQAEDNGDVRENIAPHRESQSRLALQILVRQGVTTTATSIIVTSAVSQD